MVVWGREAKIQYIEFLFVDWKSSQTCLYPCVDRYCFFSVRLFVLSSSWCDVQAFFPLWNSCLFPELKKTFLKNCEETVALEKSQSRHVNIEMSQFFWQFFSHFHNMKWYLLACLDSLFAWLGSPLGQKWKLSKFRFESSKQLLFPLQHIHKWHEWLVMKNDQKLLKGYFTAAPHDVKFEKCGVAMTSICGLIAQPSTRGGLIRTPCRIISSRSAQIRVMVSSTLLHVMISSTLLHMSWSAPYCTCCSQLCMFS